LHTKILLNFVYNKKRKSLRHTNGRTVKALSKQSWYYDVKKSLAKNMPENAFPIEASQVL